MRRFLATKHWSFPWACWAPYLYSFIQAYSGDLQEKQVAVEGWTGRRVSHGLVKGDIVVWHNLFLEGVFPSLGVAVVANLS
jgi:hypothetical protein